MTNLAKPQRPFMSSTAIPVPDREPEFTRLLREANIQLADAYKYLFVREWVKSNRRRCYIPPDVLAQMGWKDEDLI